jgi:hypothetical protein
MFDNLRDEANSQPFFEDNQQPAEPEAVTMSAPPRSGRFLGMTPIQRFVIAVLIMFMVCVLGMMCLLITGKIGFYF